MRLRNLLPQQANQIRLAGAAVGVLLILTCRSSFQRDLYRGAPNNLAFALQTPELMFEHADAGLQPAANFRVPVLAPGAFSLRIQKFVDRAKEQGRPVQCDRTECIVELEPTERLYREIGVQTQKALSKFAPAVRLVPESEAGILIQTAISYRIIQHVSSGKGLICFSCGSTFDYDIRGVLNLRAVVTGTNKEVFHCAEEIIHQSTIDFGSFAIGERGMENLENLILYGAKDYPARSVAGVLYRCAKDLGGEINANRRSGEQ